MMRTSSTSPHVLRAITCACFLAFLFLTVAFFKPKPKPLSEVIYQPMIPVLEQVENLRGGGQKYRFVTQRNSAVISYENVLVLMERGDASLLRSLTEVIKNFPSGAVFWECAPTTAKDFGDTPFEFVLLPSDRLEEVTTDIEPFQDKFREHRDSPYPPPSSAEVLAFHNLRRDAVLVVPNPRSGREFSDPPQYYAHLAAFVRGAPPEQIAALWRAVGATMLNELHEATKLLPQGVNKKLWLSTSGLGVSWLHVRVDSVPKYYNYGPYKS